MKKTYPAKGSRVEHEFQVALKSDQYYLTAPSTLPRSKGHNLLTWSRFGSLTPGNVPDNIKFTAGGCMITC